MALYRKLRNLHKDWARKGTKHVDTQYYRRSVSCILTAVTNLFTNSYKQEDIFLTDDTMQYLLYLDVSVEYVLVVKIGKSCHYLQTVIHH